jgi:uncharacterized protein (TIGR02302 family)
LTEQAPDEHKSHAIIGRRIGLARANLLWERFWPAFAPLIGLALLFVDLGLLGTWSILPFWLHIGLVALFAIGAAAALWYGVRRLAWPHRVEAMRRVEQASGLKHRPLTGLEDQLAGNPDPAARALWAAHQRRLAAALSRLTPGWPQSGLTQADAYGLRAVVVCLLFVGLVSAGRDEAPERLADAFRLRVPTAAEPVAVLDAWINPPAYTGLAPVFLTRDGAAKPAPAEAILVPTGSTLFARLSGVKEAPVLELDGQGTPFASPDNRSFLLDRKLTDGHDLRIRLGSRTLGQWPIAVLPDAPPQIRLTETPKPMPKGTLKFAYEASDDYGIKRLALEIKRTDADKIEQIELPLPGRSPKTVKETNFQDLTAHPWAGLDVVVRPLAEDVIGQQAYGDPVTVTIPERTFSHPVARALIEQRRKLTLKPAERRPVITALGAITLIPEAYDGDVTAHLGIRAARARLQRDLSDEAVPAVQDLLWDVALRLEDGGLSQAERDLRQAQQALQDALARNAPDDEIERLMAEMQRAMDRYLQALTEDALKRAENGEQPQELDPNAQVLTSDDLRKMMDKARELARNGARDAARDMLAQMQQMLESLKRGQVARQNGQQGRSQMQRDMSELGEILRRQQELMDQSFRDSRQGQQGQQGQRGQRGQQGQQQGQRGQQGQQGQQGQGQQGQGQGGEQSAEQEALRRRLGELMRRFGEQGGNIPDGFGRADRSMRDARDALGRGEPGDAVGPQGEALQALRDGARSMMEQMGQMNGGEPGEGLSGDPSQQGPGRAQAERFDPLGRPIGSDWDDGRSTKVPDAQDLQRSREILDELFRRSGEAFRPLIERDYIDRLLKRF